MSIPRLTQLAEKQALVDVELNELVYAMAEDLSGSLDLILVELKKLNLQATGFTGDEIGDEDIAEEE